MYVCIAYENRIRDQKLRMEIAQGKKENEAYLDKVEQSKKFEKMEERKHGSNGGNGNRGATSSSRDEQHQQIRRSFVQKTPTSSKQQSSLGDGDKLLEKVFAGNKKRKV